MSFLATMSPLLFVIFDKTSTPGLLVTLNQITRLLMIPHHIFSKVLMINNKVEIYQHEYILIWDEERPSLIYPLHVKDYILSFLFEPCIFSWIITQTKITLHTKGACFGSF